MKKYLPLKNIKILDLTRVLAGPYATQLAGDFGANIIKVESFWGDDTRAWKPPERDGLSTYFTSVNRNKKSIAVDLRHEKGQQVVQRLAANVDCVFENFVPGTAETFNVDYDSLRAVNERLIYGSLSGFGPLGTPKARNAAYDVMIAAEGGLMNATGTADAPVKVGVAVTDIMSGLTLLSGVLAALYERERSGVGQHVSTSLLETQVNTMCNLASAYLNADIEPKRLGTEHASIVPYQVFKTKDNHIAMGALNDAQWNKLCTLLLEAVGDAAAPLIAAVQELAQSRYATNEQRVQHRAYVCSTIEQVLQRRSTATWQRALSAAKLPNSPLNTMAQVFDDEQVKALRLKRSVALDENAHVAYVRSPVTFGGSTLEQIERNDESHCLPPPLHVGQHTTEILLENGFDQIEIDQLKNEKIIK